jgi:hypothetical protein
MRLGILKVGRETGDFGSSSVANHVQPPNEFRYEACYGNYVCDRIVGGIFSSRVSALDCLGASKHGTQRSLIKIPCKK